MGLAQGSEVHPKGGRDALGWPLVWDQGDQTVVQSPLGGTKLSWDVWGAGAGQDRNRQRFDLLAADPGAEADRLASLGAARVAELPDGFVLADPGGDEFRLRPA